MTAEKYIELKMTYPHTMDEQQYGIDIAALSEWGFDTFSEEEQENAVLGYVKQESYLLNKQSIDQYVTQLQARAVCCQFTEIEQQNWNALWESNFEPIDVEGRCCVRADFHAPAATGIDIVITPKMSFGTGHHATTYLMIQQLLDTDFTGQVGLDMGCGTGVLAILALKRGASFMHAVDIDAWACENAIENAQMNQVSDKMDVVLGDVAKIEGLNCDFILANINRNILLADMEKYTKSLRREGSIFFSGFLQTDVQDIANKANSVGLEVVKTIERDGWMLVKCVKK